MTDEGHPEMNVLSIFKEMKNALQSAQALLTKSIHHLQYTTVLDATPFICNA